jgi:hypothetical protein
MLTQRERHARKRRAEMARNADLKQLRAKVVWFRAEVDRLRLALEEMRRERDYARRP